MLMVYLLDYTEDKNFLIFSISNISLFISILYFKGHYGVHRFVRFWFQYKKIHIYHTPRSFRVKAGIIYFKLFGM